MVGSTQFHVVGPTQQQRHVVGTKVVDMYVGSRVMDKGPSLVEFVGR